MNIGSFKMGKWIFTPGLLSSMITVILFAVFVYLGYWQYSRAKYKQQLTQQLNNSKTIEDFSHKNDFFLGNKTNDLQFKKVKLSGYFMNDKQILLDNQILKGKPGYHIISAFKPDNHNHLILINRGWYPWGKDRNILPQIKPILEKVTIKGMILLPKSGFLLKEETLDSSQSILVVQQINFEKLSKAFKQRLVPYIIYLFEDSPYGYRSFPISFGLSEERHLGYALQWFTMAIAVLIYFGVIHCQKLKAK